IRIERWVQPHPPIPFMRQPVMSYRFGSKGGFNHTRPYHSCANPSWRLVHIFRAVLNAWRVDAHGSKSNFPRLLMISGGVCQSTEVDSFGQMKLRLTRGFNHLPFP